ncbi:MAG: polysaccharide pyruvyl transferase family protein [Alphaproteobacteria bacterium]
MFRAQSSDAFPSAPTGDGPAVMRALAAAVEDIAKLIPPGQPAVYLDYPVHLNVGDLLIEAGTEHFFRRFALDVIERRSAYDFGAAARRRVTPDSVILLHGGGNFGDLYPLHQKFREDVVARFPKNRIVMLPQTLHFDSPAALDACAAAFARHPDLHICLRDVPSFETVKRRFANAAYLAPDMAHLLWEPLAGARAKTQGQATLLFARIDKEGRPLPLPPGTGRRALLDWKNIIRMEEKALYQALLKLHRHRGGGGGAFSLHPLWRIFRNRLVASTVRFLGDYDTVVTNRLHMALLSLLLGRQVTMADNSYGKLSQYHAAWLAGHPDVRLAR